MMKMKLAGRDLAKVQELEREYIPRALWMTDEEKRARGIQ